MIRIKNKLTTGLLLVLLLTSACSNNLSFKDSYLYKYSSNESGLVISSNNYKRLEEFFKGKFFSYEQNNYQAGATGVYFALSKTGNVSVMSFCNEGINECILNNMQFITKAKCERISKEACFVVAANDRIILNNKYYLINQKNMNEVLSSTFKIFKNDKLEEKFDDIRVALYRDYDGSNSYD
jgi:hypothetical protein